MAALVRRLQAAHQVAAHPLDQDRLHLRVALFDRAAGRSLHTRPDRLNRDLSRLPIGLQESEDLFQQGDDIAGCKEVLFPGDVDQQIGCNAVGNTLGSRMCSKRAYGGTTGQRCDTPGTSPVQYS